MPGAGRRARFFAGRRRGLGRRRTGDGLAVRRRGRRRADRAELPRIYDLLHQTYQNAQVPLSDISLFENAFDILRPLGMARFLAVYLEERPIAVSIDLLFKDRVYYWYGGMDRDYSKQHPNEYLRWSIIQRGKQEGSEKCKSFDQIFSLDDKLDVVFV